MDDIRSRLENLPHDWWRIPPVAQGLATKVFRKHMMFVLAQFTKDGDRKRDYFTGFLVAHEGVMVWVTAGHVVNTLHALRTDPSVTDVQVSLCDCPDVYRDALPFDLLGMVGYSVDEDGFDLGIVPLETYYQDLLFANPAFEPITDTLWHRHEESDPEGFFVVGTPFEWVNFNPVESSDFGTRIAIRTSLVCAPVDRIPDEGKQHCLDEFWGVDGAFYGQMEEVCNASGARLSSVKGMSGGPIFSVERVEGRVKYRLHAVQSMSLEPSRKIRGTTIRLVERAIKAFNADRKTARTS